MIKIKLNESERKYLIDILMSRDLNLGDDINELDIKIKNESVLDNDDPTKQEIKDHNKRINRLNNELKELKEALDLNSNIIDKLKMRI